MVQKLAIHRDLEKTVSDWMAGKPLRAPRLGHSHREMTWGPNNQNRIDDSKIFYNRQELALEWTFFVIHEFLKRNLGARLFGDEAPFTYSDFALLCDELEATQMPKHTGKLSPEELAGAESLAWKAVLVGWNQAIQGFPDNAYLETSRPER